MKLCKKCGKIISEVFFCGLARIVCADNCKCVGDQ